MPTKTGTKPFALNKDLGAPLTSSDLDFTNSDSEGNPVIPLTPEQKYIFDVQGWLLIPSILGDEEIAAMKAFITQLHQEPKTLPDYQQTPLADPTQRLVDHPVILGFLNEFVYIPYTDGRGHPLTNENATATG